MSTALWAVLVGGAFLAGVTVVVALVTVRSREPFVAILGVVSISASAWAFGRLGSVYASVDVLVYAFGLAVGGFGGGYALASALLDRMSREPGPPAVQPGEDSGRIRVLLFACAEGDHYEPHETARELGRLADEGLVTLTIGVTPFMYAAQKGRYRAIGGRSPERGQATQLAETIEQRLRADPAGRERIERVDAAWCDGPEGLQAMVANAVATGCRHIIVAPVAVGESAEMADAKRLVDRMRLAESGVSVVHMRPLWCAEPIVLVLVERIFAAVDDAASTGVALIAHGQPASREQAYASFDADESAFLNRVRMLLAERGVDEARVRIGWAEWRDPDVTSTVRHLAALGCTRVIVVPACFPFDNLLTRLDLPVSVRQARSAASVSVITLNAWSDDPAIPAALADAIREASEDAEESGPARS